MTCAPSEVSDQPGPPSLIRVFAVRMKKHWTLSYPAALMKMYTAIKWTSRNNRLGMISGNKLLATLGYSIKQWKWATSWENLFMPYVNNKGADQPAHPRSLISAFVVRCLDSITPLVSIPEISSLYLASVTAQAGLSLPGSQTLKTGFHVTTLKYFQGLAGSVTIKARSPTLAPKIKSNVFDLISARALISAPPVLFWKT